MSEFLTDKQNYVNDSGEEWGAAEAAKRLMTEPQGAVEDEVPPQSRVERQQSLLRNYGFIADSLEELSRAVALTMDDTLGPGRAAKYVNTIQLRQAYKSSSEDPRAAARSVTATIAGFAAKPGADITFLSQLSDLLDGRHAAPRSMILEAVPMLADWRNDAGTQRALVDILRYKEIRESIENDTEDRTAESNYKETPDLIRRVNNLLQQHHVRELRNFINSRVEQHRNQADFWVEKLQEIEAGSMGDVRQIASRALANMKKQTV